MAQGSSQFASKILKRKHLWPGSKLLSIDIKFRLTNKKSLKYLIFSYYHNINIWRLHYIKLPIGASSEGIFYKWRFFLTNYQWNLVLFCFVTPITMWGGLAALIPLFFKNTVQPNIWLGYCGVSQAGTWERESRGIGLPTPSHCYWSHKTEK